MTFFAFIVGMFVGAAVGIIAAALADAGKDDYMSTDKWRWTPDCDRDVCVGDCDLCTKNTEDEEEAEEDED